MQMCLALPGRVVSVHGDDPTQRTARVSFAGAVREVSLARVPQARPGDHVLVHVGMAVALIDAAEAKRARDFLDDLELPPTTAEADDGPSGAP